MSFKGHYGGSFCSGNSIFGSNGSAGIGIYFSLFCSLGSGDY